MKSLFLFLICLLAVPAVYAQTEPSVTFNPNTGNYIIRYQGLDGNLVETFFEPATKIEPGIVATVLVESGSYRYHYIVRNGSSSQQRLLNFSIRLFSTIDSITRPNQKWRTGLYSSPVAVYWSNTLRDPSGLYTLFDGVAPDSAVSGFSFKSSGLPAIVTANFRGNAPLSIVFPDEPPGEIAALLRPLRQFPANTVQSNTVGPKEPPTPFSVTAFLDSLISYTNQSLAFGWIANQLTADKYTNLFSTARSQLESTDTTGARVTLTSALANVTVDSAAVLLTSEAYALLRFNTEYLLDQLPSPELIIDIDIKPRSDPNSINCKNHNGVIPVAILTTNTFDATTVDPLTVRFGRTGTEASEAHNKGHIEDADGDGDLDMVLHFRFGNTGIQCGDTEATLTGQTNDGMQIRGTDAIQTVGQ
jgi:hypothetical protein